MLAQADLADRADDEVAELSGGNRQRVNIAIGLIADPAVLLLDEPSTALDPRQRERLWEFVGGLTARGTSIVYSTHIVQEAERYADRVLVLADGELIFTGTPRELEAESGRVGRGLRGGVRALPARARALRPADAVAVPQGPADPAPLAAARRPARRLSGGDRRADRARPVPRPGQAEGGLLQPGAAERPARSGWAGRRSTHPGTPTSCSSRSTRSRFTAARRRSTR